MVRLGSESLVDLPQQGNVAQCGVAVHEVRKQRTALEELFARLTEADQNGTLSEVDRELEMPISLNGEVVR